MSENTGARVKVQKFGTFLSGMVMPNIGAFIAWGIITMLFIPDGFFPNEELVKLVDPILFYLLPILIGYTGGKMAYDGDHRGGVVGAVATMGVIVGSTIPMFLGAMIMGPTGGYAIKKVDAFLQPRTKAGFEMLVNNFSAGILGTIIAIIAFYFVGPLVDAFTIMLGNGVQFLVDHGVLFLTSILIEPAKVLFLNNAINHGVLTPLGTAEAQETGKSILFLLEANPGPGLGVLLAFMFFGKGTAKATAPGAIIIQFFGGIHEIYFPYILMKPKMILAAILGGMSGIIVFTIFDAGLAAPASPGSIFAIIAMAPQGGGNLLGVLLGVAAAAVVSFLVGAIILKADKSDDADDLNEATAKMEEMKGKKSSVASTLTGATTAESADFDPAKIKKIVFACDAGMGSSAMGASVLRNKAKKLELDVEVINTAIRNLPADADLVISHKDLTDRAKQQLPTAHHVSVENFLNSPVYDEVLSKLK